MIELLGNIPTEQLSLIINILNMTLLSLLFLYLKFGIEKRIRKYEHFISDAGELNTKMHDRLVEVANLIESTNPIQADLEKRLSMNASRLEKYDPEITNLVKELVTTWNGGFNHESESTTNSEEELQTRKDGCLKIIANIKSRVDKLVK